MYPPPKYLMYTVSMAFLLTLSIYEIFIGHFIFLMLDFIHNISGERIFLFISMFSSLFSKNKSR